MLIYQLLVKVLRAYKEEEIQDQGDESRAKEQCKKQVVKNLRRLQGK